MNCPIIHRNISIITALMVFYIFLSNTFLTPHLFTSNSQLIIHSIALLTLAIITPFSFKCTVDTKEKIARILSLIAVCTVTLSGVSSVIYFLFYIQIYQAINSSNSLRFLLVFCTLVTGLYLTTFYTNGLLREELINWGALGVAINYLSVIVIEKVNKSYRKTDQLNKILTNILKTTTNGIHFIDKEGKTIILNHAAQLTIGNKTASEVYGKFDWELFYDGIKFNEQGKYTSMITETLETGKSYQDIERIVTDQNGISRTYLIKTCRLYSDNNEILGAMGFYQDISKQKNFEREMLDAHYEISKLAITDELTQLYNVRYFRQRLTEEMGKAYNSHLSLMIIDIDYFKSYNDLYGHVAGDKLLYKLAQLIKTSVRTTDIVARYGGEEFTVIMPGMNKDKCIEAAERVRVSVREFDFFGKEKLPGGRLTVTIGIASTPEDTRNADELIRLADLALYRGKDSNRDMVVAQ